MDETGLEVSIVPGAALAPDQLSAVIALCERAYQEPIAPYLEHLPAPVHVLAHAGGALVSHACWVTRQLQAGDGPRLRTAYVELVATEPGMERRGYAGAVMRRLAAAVSDYDLGGLSTGIPAFYARLGWELWRGPLAVRLPPEEGGGLLSTPDEQVMVLRLPRTPPSLALDALLTGEWRPGEELW